MIFYSELAKYYDKIYHYIDYGIQTDLLIKLISKFNDSKNKKVLDVACGSGEHISFLHKAGFD